MTTLKSKNIEHGLPPVTAFYRGQCCQVSSLTIGKETLRILISNGSDHPIHNVSVHIMDYQSRSDLITSTPQTTETWLFPTTFDPCDLSVTIESLDRHSQVILASFPQFYLDKQTLKVHIFFQEGDLTYQKEFSHVGNHKWVFAEKIVNSATNDVLFKSLAKPS